MTTSTTSVTLTGTGVPHPAPGRAGAGALVQHGEIALQFDAGRATVLRLVEADCPLHQLDAVFITHVHSDHVIDLADLVMTRWIQQTLHPCAPIPIIVPSGEAATFVRSMLDPYRDDIAVRMAHVQPDPPEFTVHEFTPASSPVEVWRDRDHDVVVEAVAIHHEPVNDAVAYRVTTPNGAVVISGDTRVCAEVEDLARGAHLLVHEACRASAMAPLIAGTAFEKIFDYHADTVALGGLAQRAEVPHVVLTHLIPAPASEQEEADFADDLRRGGYLGRITVGRDLMRFELGSN